MNENAATKFLLFVGLERERLALAWQKLQGTKLYDVIAATPVLVLYGVSS